MKTERWLAVLTALAVLWPAGACAAGEADLTLEECIAAALRESVALQSARQGVAGAEAQRKEAFTAFLPKLSTGYSYTRYNAPQTFLFPGNPPVAVVAGTKDNYVWVVEATQPVFAGGGIAAAYRSAGIGAGIAREEERIAVQDLVLEVKVAYVDLLKAGKILAVAEQSAARLEAHRGMAQGFFEVGMIPRNDLLQAEVELANGRQVLVRAAHGVDRAKAKLNTVLRRPVDAPLRVADILRYTPHDHTFEACLETARKNRPELRAFDLRRAQAAEGVALAKSEYYPSVHLVGQYKKFGDTPSVSGSPYQPQENWNVMAMMQWKFWEWGKTGHRVAFSRTRMEQADLARKHLEDQIALEVKNAYLLLIEAEKEIRVAETAIAQAEENFRLNTERYREQVATSTDVIDAQTLLARARSNLANALGDYHISQTRLERAMGAADPGRP